MRDSFWVLQTVMVIFAPLEKGAGEVDEWLKSVVC